MNKDDIESAKRIVGEATGKPPEIMVVNDHTAKQFGLPHGGVYRIFENGGYEFLAEDMITYLASRQPNDLPDSEEDPGQPNDPLEVDPLD